MWGVKYNGVLGGLHFWFMFVGSNMVFFPQHFLGLNGMPRRYVDYTPAFREWHHWSTIGYYVVLVGMTFFFLGLIEAMIRRRKAEANPWGEGATTLEWTLSSPPPFHQYNDLPRVR
jgi:cytochrome c oxidase subunit 1